MLLQMEMPVSAPAEGPWNYEEVLAPKSAPKGMAEESQCPLDVPSEALNTQASVRNGHSFTELPHHIKANCRQCKRC